MNTSREALEKIAEFEGIRTEAYLDPTGTPTIGIGHTAGVKMGDRITREHAIELFANDIKQREAYVNATGLTLSQGQYDALVSFVFNCGAGNLQKLIKGRDYRQIAEAMLSYNKSKGKVLPGLTRRRQWEHDLFLGVNQGEQKMRIGHASIDEHGSSRGGQFGDQTGKEVCIRQWYNKNWTVLLRAKDEKIAERMASVCESCCSNRNIGYDQNQRNTLHDEARAVGYDLTKLCALCETDCSAFMTLCAIAAGVDALEYTGNAPTTRTMTAEFGKTGKFLCYTDPKYLKGIEYLKRGDILVAPGSHTVMVLDNGPRIKDDIEYVAREVLRGKYGNGAERKAALKAAGHNPAAVQAMVNRLVSSAT